MVNYRLFFLQQSFLKTCFSTDLFLYLQTCFSCKNYLQIIWTIYLSCISPLLDITDHQFGFKAELGTDLCISLLGSSAGALFQYLFIFSVVCVYCCDRKSRAAYAQSFAPWQQATIEITRRDHYNCLFAPHTYIFVLRAHPVRGETHNQRNTTGEVATVWANTYLAMCVSKYFSSLCSLNRSVTWNMCLCQTNQ